MDRHGEAQLLSVQVRAIEALLNRGWGTARQTVVMQGDVTIRVVTPLTRSENFGQ